MATNSAPAQGATATTKPAEPQPAPAPVTDETSPDFEWNGLARRNWGPLYLRAWEAHKGAQAAEAAVAEAEAREAEARERIPAMDAAARKAAEEAEMAAARLRRAEAATHAATNRKERDAAEALAATARKEAEVAAVRAADLRQTVETARSVAPMMHGEVERLRDRAARLRLHANQALAEGEQRELPTRRREVANAEAGKLAHEEADKLRAARAHLARLRCRDCRYWEPDPFTPRHGTCHLAPPGSRGQLGIMDTAPAVPAENWCAQGEPIPPPPADGKDANAATDSADGKDA